MRWPVLLLGSALPWLVRAWTRAWFDERSGWQGALCLLLPLTVAATDAPMLLAVDEKALRVRERADRLRSLCNRSERPRALRRLDLYQGRGRMAFCAGRVPGPGPGPGAATDQQCLPWRSAHEAESGRG